MVQPFGHVAQLHEFLEIGHRGIAASADRVMDEGRAIDWGQNQIASTDFDGAFRIAGVLGEGGRRRAAQLAGKTTRDADTFAVDFGPCLAPALKGGGVVDEIHTDLGQHGFGVGLDDLERLFVQDLVIGDVALDVLCSFHRYRRAFGAPGRTAAASGSLAGAASVMTDLHTRCIGAAAAAVGHSII